MENSTRSVFDRVRLPIAGLVLLAVTAMTVAACDGEATNQGEESPIRLEPHPAGDAEVGEALVQSYGCTTCHVIPDLNETSHVGPPLTSFARREYIAGRIPNSADNLVLWILDPQSVDPQTAMPDVGASQQEAQDIAAFLATLE